MSLRAPEAYFTLLRVRQRREEARARALAATRRESEHAQRQRQRLVEMQLQTIVAAGEASRTLEDPAGIRRLLQYERHLARRVVEKDAQLEGLRTDEEKKRSALEDAIRERKVAQRLIERARRAQDDARRRRDQILADEIASVRAARSAEARRRQGR